MENTDSDILRLRLTSSLMWISNRGHVFRIGGIILHPTGVFSNVLMQKKRHESRTTSDLSKSDCSVHDRCVNDIMFTIVFRTWRERHCLTTDILGYNLRQIRTFFINVDIEPWSRLPYWRHHITSDWRVLECVDAKEAT